MTYRSGPCAFCDEQGQLSCPRCAAHVCSTHGPGAAAHCTMCEKELRDDLEEAAFVARLKEGGEDRGIFVRRRHPFVDLVDWIASSISKSLAERRVRKTFARRTHEDIAAWRKQAGIVARGTAG